MFVLLTYIIQCQIYDLEFYKAKQVNKYSQACMKPWSPLLLFHTLHVLCSIYQGNAKRSVWRSKLAPRPCNKSHHARRAKKKKKKTSLDLDLESMLDGFLVYQPNTGAASWVALTKMLLTVAEENESSTNSKGNGSAASYLSLWMRFLQREKNIEVSLL